MQVRVTTKPWTCQLVHVDEIDAGLGLDLIALDTCPFPSIAVREGTPFVIRVLHDQANECVDLVRAWADEGLVLAIHLIRAQTGRWLCVSDGAQQLLLELTAETTRR